MTAGKRKQPSRRDFRREDYFQNWPFSSVATLGGGAAFSAGEPLRYSVKQSKGLFDIGVIDALSFGQL